MRRFRTLSSLFPVFRHLLRHAEGSSCGVLVASQDGCPRGEVCARVAGPSAGPAECCLAASRVSGQLRVRLGLHRETCEEGKGHRQAARGPGESLRAEVSGSKGLQ